MNTSTFEPISPQVYAGLLKFLHQAIEDNDLKAFTQLLKLQHQIRSLELARERFEFSTAKTLLKYSEAIAQLNSDPQLSPQDKIQRLRQTLWPQGKTSPLPAPVPEAHTPAAPASATNVPSTPPARPTPVAPQGSTPAAHVAASPTSKPEGVAAPAAHPPFRWGMKFRSPQGTSRPQGSPVPRLFPEPHPVPASPTGAPASKQSPHP